MKLLLPRKQEIQPSGQQPPVPSGERLRRLLTSWEIYPILLVAAFLRLFSIDNVIFGQDEADVFQLAHDAVAHGLWPIAGNQASVGSMHPPLDAYLFMIPAAFSANPLGGQILVALFNVAAVLLTYCFARRYYGRLTGTIAALLFATAVGAWQYSRHIWSPNFEPFFVILFLWMLFLGVVERRKGWLIPAITLLGALYQFHESALFLCIPLLGAVLLAFRTIRLRDIGFAILGLLLVFAPYLFWEFHSNFSDVKLLLTTSTQKHPSIDTGALQFYLFFIRPFLASPYLDPITRIRDNHLLLPDAQSILVATPLRDLHLHFLLSMEFILAVLLLAGGIVIAAALVLFHQVSSPATSGASTKKGIARWWADFQATPYRQGLLLLLLWQVVPLVLLTRHSLVLFTHYFLFLLPGEFILIAFCVTQMIALLQKQQPEWGKWFRSGMAGLAALMILAQLIGSGSTLIDQTTGNFSAHSVFPHYTDLHSLQNALEAADRLAQQRGIHRIYALEIGNTASAMNYLSEQVKTPIELNNVKDCFVLPDPSAGPVVLLADSETQEIATIMLNAYTNATLIEEPQQLGASPYKLYILTAKPLPAPAPRSFSQGLRLVSPTASVIPGTFLLTTRWRILDTHKPAPRTFYHFDFHIQADNGSNTLDCKPTATWAGDQLVTYQSQTPGSTLPGQLTVQVSTFTSQPPVIHAGSLTLTTGANVNTPTQTLYAADQQNSITLPVVAAP